VVFVAPKLVWFDPLDRSELGKLVQDFALLWLDWGLARFSLAHLILLIITVLLLRLVVCLL